MEERTTPPDYSAEVDSARPTEREQRVEAAEALLQEIVEHPSQFSPLVRVAARKEPMDLRLQEALEDSDRRRGLTARE